MHANSSLRIRFAATGMILTQYENLRSILMKQNLHQSLMLLLLLSLGSAAYANVCSSVPGSVTCGNGSLDRLSGNGIVTLNSTTVTGPTTVNGVLSAEGANFETLDVNGSADLSNCIVNQSGNIKGALSAQSTKFRSILNVYSSTTKLINTKITTDLHIHHTDSKKQVVYLEKSTEISGNIIFDDRNGVVIISKDSKISGKVVGGKISYR